MTTAHDVLEHRDAMLDVFTEITQDCVLLGLTPTRVEVSRWPSGSLTAVVQFSRQDTAAVNQLAASYGCTQPGAVGDSNYGLTGRLDIDGRRVEVVVFTGRPVLPPHPVGYAPQAVEA